MSNGAAEEEARLPSLADTLAGVRQEAERQPNVWHTSPTRRSGVHVAWMKRVDDGGESELVRISRDHIRPFSEDLLVISRYLPEGLEIASTEPRKHERSIILTLQRARRHAAARACSRCGKPAGPRFPLIGNDRICLLCAAGMGA